MTFLLPDREPETVPCGFINVLERYIPMRVLFNTVAIAPIIVAIAAQSASGGTFTEYTDSTQWQDAAGQWTTIGFTDLEWGEVVATQYSSLGVTFTEGDDNVQFIASAFEDDWGLRGSFALDPDDSITVEFDSPMYSIGIDFPGFLHIDLYQGDAMIHSTLDYGGGFLGVVSSIPFDRARITDPTGFVFIDDLHFGGVPAPGALPLLGALLLQSRRRRS